MHLSMFNNKLFCLQQIVQNFRSSCNKAESEDDFTNQNNFISSAGKSLREFRKCKSLIDKINNSGTK